VNNAGAVEQHVDGTDFAEQVPTAPSSRTSSLRRCRVGPSAISRNFSSFKSVAQTVAPARMNASAAARPIPCAAAVTTTTLFDKFVVI
jgi:hypothetical protein